MFVKSTRFQQVDSGVRGFTAFKKNEIINELNVC